MQQSQLDLGHNKVQLNQKGNTNLGSVAGLPSIKYIKGQRANKTRFNPKIMGSCNFLRNIRDKSETKIRVFNNINN